MDFIPDNAIGIIVAAVITLAMNHVVSFVKDVRNEHFTHLERDLALQKDIGDKKASNALDELVRRRLNSYVIHEMNGRDQKKSGKWLVNLLYVLWVIPCITMVIALFHSKYDVAFFWFVLWILFICIWSTVHSKNRIRDFEKSVTYKAHFHDDIADNYYADVHLLRPHYDKSVPGTWQHDVLYIEDKGTGRVRCYELTKSSGYISSDSTKTNLAGEYRFVDTQNLTRKIKRSKSFIEFDNLRKSIISPSHFFCTNGN